MRKSRSVKHFTKLAPQNCPLTLEKRQLGFGLLLGSSGEQLDFSGMAPVSDGFLQAVLIEAKVWLPGETESGSAGTQPDEG